MIKKIQSYVEEYTMIEEGDRIILGVSGGADSVCLFHALLYMMPKYHLQLFAVHVNHGIRGIEATEDEHFVRCMCQEAGVPCEVYQKDVPKLAKEQGLTEEEAGRNLRYDAFYQSFEKNHCTKIAIAHNMNDDAETFLFHLFRGSGITGLSGIPKKRNQIIRPLLCMKREEIEQYLRENQIEYRNDSTNALLDYSRNKIRHRVISYAKEELNYKTVEHIVSAANHLREISEYLDKNIEVAYHKTVEKIDENCYEILLQELKEEDKVIQSGIIRSVLRNLLVELKDVESLHIEQIRSLLEKEVGKHFYLKENILGERGYDRIVLTNRNHQKTKEECERVLQVQEQKLCVPGNFFLPFRGETLVATLLNYKKNMIIPKNGYTKWFDYDKISNTVFIRTRQEGDFFQLNEEGNHKTIKSFFIHEKIPKNERDQIPLIADGSHIMWIVGDRISEAYKVNENTKVILELRLVGGKLDAEKY